jgi:hypothetical protein
VDNVDKQKKWTTIIGYFIPVLALIIGNVLQIDNVQIEGALTTILASAGSVVAGVLALIGIIKSHDKNKQA